MKKNNKKGYVLVSVITLSAMVLIIGTSSLYMASLGSQTVSSEIQYNKALHAAEYALNAAVKDVIDENYQTSTYNLSPTQNIDGEGYVKLNDSGAKYKYSTVTDSTKENCFIYAEGKFNNLSKVVKTTIIPIKRPSSLQAGMVTKGISATTLNGNNTSIGNNCGSAGVITDDNTSQTVITDLEGSGGAIGSPKVDHSQNITSDKIYQATFGSTITNYSTLHSNISTKVSNIATSLPSSCVFTPTVLAGSSCTSDGTSITCSSTTETKTITISGTGACTEVAIKANIVNITGNNSTVKYNVHAENKVNVSADAKGLIASKGELNIDSNGDKMEGIFIGASAPKPSNNKENPDFQGRPEFKGLLFYGNATGTSNISTEFSGNTSFLGAFVVDGNLSSFRRDGGGNAGPGVYNIQYDNNKLNEWGSQSQYSGLLNNFDCGPSENPAVLTSLTKTKMTMF